MAPTETIDTFRMNLLVTKLVELTIMDVRPKPPGVTAALAEASRQKKLLQSDVTNLASKGFYFTADGGLLSNQGEVVFHATTGIFYILRFGAVAYGTPDSRFLFISVGFDPKVTQGVVPDAVRTRLDVLRARFAPWYYLVSNDSFEKIRIRRSALVKSRTAARPK